MGWYLVPSLVALRNEANSLYPNRDKSSDGSIGDAAHSSRESDHNPDDKGAVHAYDLDEDLDGNQSDSGDELAFLAESIRSRRDPRVKYVIYGGRIFASYSTSTRKAWTWGPYTGTNAHLKHMHVSVLSTDVGENDTRPWFPQEDDLPTPAEVWAHPLKNVYDTVDASSPAGELLTFAHAHAYEAKQGVTTLNQRVAALEAAVAAITTGTTDAEVVKKAVREVFADAGQE
jgi:hypothetical protein